MRTIVHATRMTSQDVNRFEARLDCLTWQWTHAEVRRLLEEIKRLRDLLPDLAGVEGGEPR